MKAVGIVCEYNPFHNGHLYQIQKVKELFPDSIIIVILSGNVTERGELSILSKWDKTEIALHYGIDLVIELSFLFASQSADTFCFGALKILNEIGIDTLIFGSEIGSVETLKKCAQIQLSDTYQQKLQSYLKEGNNYPTALSKALLEESGISISKPNDLLGLGYVKEIIKNNYSIEPITIKRTNDYHNINFTGNISSATSIRNHLKEQKEIENTVPTFVIPYLKKPIFLRDFFPYIKYKIITEKNLEKYETVDEKLVNKMKENIIYSTSLEEFIDSMKNKYYTYNRLMRMCSHILFSFTKEENLYYKNKFYIRILGFNDLGREYLNKQKKKIQMTIITNYSNDKENLLSLDLRVAKVLSLIKGNSFFEEEWKRNPIYKKKDE